MEQFVILNNQGLPEIENTPDAPGQTLPVHRSLELLRQRIRQLQLMTEYSPANIALQFAVKYFSTPTLQASHIEIIADLLRGKETLGSEKVKELKRYMEGVLNLSFKEPEQPSEQPEVGEETLQEHQAATESGELKGEEQVDSNETTTWETESVVLG